jgi:hypothetical protein
MKLTNITILPDGSSLGCDLSFRDPGRANPFNIKGVFGLDADQIVPRYYGSSGRTSEGSEGSGSSVQNYYNLMLVKRDIVFRIELNPQFSNNESYSDLRDRLMKMIASSRTGAVTIQFKNENEIVAMTKGFIVKFEAATSTNSPEVQLSIVCEPD